MTDNSAACVTAFERCRCRPACLSTLTVDDSIVLTDNGPALAEHVDPSLAYPQEPLFDLQGRAS